ncbi:hypothetical protein QTH91_21885 [Variovorax dokdonensis]|uniref:Uncharacterized protein n=1 Tax=Variovorax dokdonensis TaxID=344883 RepID=A0ABT7NGS7_9BURK|nr:hypothetical protein [Variovorax dokdonensis]MDM0047158.1 hypothetical protein [Variovorax dokdonensis]
MFNLFSRNSHLRRAMALLEEAQMARLEHQAAAEHHAALARMYSDRAKRLEREIYGASHPGHHESVSNGPVTAPGKLAHDKPALYALDAARAEPKAS